MYKNFDDLNIVLSYKEMKNTSFKKMSISVDMRLEIPKINRTKILRMDTILNTVEQSMAENEKSASAGEERRANTSSNTPLWANTSSPTNNVNVSVVAGARAKVMQSIQKTSQCYDSDWSTG